MKINTIGLRCGKKWNEFAIVMNIKLTICYLCFWYIYDNYKKSL